MASAICYFDGQENGLLIMRVLREKGVFCEQRVTTEALYEKEPFICKTYVYAQMAPEKAEAELEGRGLPERIVCPAEEGNLPVRQAFLPEVEEIVERLKEAYLSESDAYPWVVAFSGGKDSTMAGLCLWKALLRIEPELRTREVHFITSDTGLENKIMRTFMSENVERINKSAEEQGLPLKAWLVMPELKERFAAKVIGKGTSMPEAGNRIQWCTGHWKIEPANRFIKGLSARFGGAVVLTGARKSESQKRSQSIKKHGDENLFIFPKEDGKFGCHPIKDLSDEQVWQTLREAKTFPWGTPFEALDRMYGQTGECPMQIEKEGRNCGTSRNGCVICQMVQDDKMLQYFVADGQEWAAPMQEFSQLLRSMRNDANMRRGMNFYRRREMGRYNPFAHDKMEMEKERKTAAKGKGAAARKREFEAKKREAEETEETRSRPLCLGAKPVYPDAALGSFSLAARILLLKNALYCQKLAGLEIVSSEEVEYIKACWREEFGWEENPEDLRPEPAAFGEALVLKEDYALNAKKSKASAPLFYVRREFGLSEKELVEEIFDRAEKKAGFSIPYFFDNGWRFENGKRIWWNVAVFCVCRPEIKTLALAAEFAERFIEAGMKERTAPDWSKHFQTV